MKKRRFLNHTKSQGGCRRGRVCSDRTRSAISDSEDIDLLPLFSHLLLITVTSFLCFHIISKKIIIWDIKILFGGASFGVQVAGKIPGHGYASANASRPGVIIQGIFTASMCVTQGFVSRTSSWHVRFLAT